MARRNAQQRARTSNNQVFHENNGDPVALAEHVRESAAWFEARRQAAADHSAILGDVGDPAAMQAAMAEAPDVIPQSERYALTFGELRQRALSVDTRVELGRREEMKPSFRATQDPVKHTAQLSRPIKDGQWQTPDVGVAIGDIDPKELFTHFLVYGGTGLVRPQDLRAKPATIGASSSPEGGLLDQLTLDKYGVPVEPSVPNDHPLMNLYRDLMESGDADLGFDPLQIKTDENGRRYLSKPQEDEYFGESDVYESAKDAYAMLASTVPTEDSLNATPVDQAPDPSSLVGRLGIARTQGLAPVTLRDVDQSVGPVAQREAFSRGVFSRPGEMLERRTESENAGYGVAEDEADVERLNTSQMTPVVMDMTRMDQQERYGTARMGMTGGFDAALRMLGDQFSHAVMDHVTVLPYNPHTGEVRPGMTLTNLANQRKILGVDVNPGARTDEQHRNVANLVARHDALLDETQQMVGGAVHTPHPVFGTDKVSTHPSYSHLFDENGLIPGNESRLSAALSGQHVSDLASRVTGMEDYKSVVAAPAVFPEPNIGSPPVDPTPDDIAQATNVQHFAGLSRRSGQQDGRGEEFRAQVSRGMLVDAAADPATTGAVTLEQGGGTAVYKKTKSVQTGNGPKITIHLNYGRRAPGTALGFDSDARRFHGGFAGTKRATRQFGDQTIEQKNWIDHVNDIIQEHDLQGDPNDILNQALKIKEQKDWDSRRFTQHRYHGFTIARHSTKQVHHIELDSPVTGVGAAGLRRRLERDPDVASFQMWRLDKDGNQAEATEGRKAFEAAHEPTITHRIGSNDYGHTLAQVWSKRLTSLGQRKNAVSYEPPKKGGDQGVFRVHHRVAPVMVAPLKYAMKAARFDGKYKVIHEKPPAETRSDKAREQEVAANNSPITAARKKEAENAPKPVEAGSVEHAQQYADMFNENVSKVVKTGLPTWGGDKFTVVPHPEGGRHTIQVHEGIPEQAWDYLKQAAVVKAALRHFDFSHKGKVLTTKK